MTNMNKDEILKDIANMTVMECVELTKVMEEKFGVSAEDLQPVIIEQAVEEVAEEEEGDVAVMLTGVGDNRVNVVKAIRAHTGLGLKESLDIAKSIPVQVGDSVPRIAAEELKRLLEDAGGTVEIK